MNLREQFEKETTHDLLKCDSVLKKLGYFVMYSEWLEQRNAEMVEALDRVVEQNPDDLPGETMLKIEQALRNNQ